MVDELRALREPRPKASDDAARIDRYVAILRDRQMPRHVLHGLVLNTIGRMTERDPSLLHHAEVRNAFALIGTPSFTNEVPPEREAASDALRALAENEVEARQSAIRAFADAVIMWPEEAAIEVAHYAMQHVAMSADHAAFWAEVEAGLPPDSALEPRQVTGGHDASSTAIGREVSEQIDALLALLA